MSRRWRCWSMPAGVLLAGSLGVTGLAGGLGAGTAAGLQGERRAQPGSPVAVQLTAVRPAALRPGDDLVVTGRVRNTSGAVLRGLRVGLRVQSERLTTRQQVRAWSAADPLAAAGVPVGAAHEAPSRLAAGRSTGFRLTLPAAALGLPAGAEQFGPRGISVQVTGPAGEQLGLGRSSVVWYPGRAFRPTRLSLLVPITANLPTRSAAEPAAALDAALRSGGRLDRVLRSAQAAELDWAIDPALLLAAHRTGAGQPPSGTAAAEAGLVPAGQPAQRGPTASTGPAPGASPSSSPSGAAQRAAGAWLEAFRAGRDGRTVTALPFADTDVAALTRRRAAGLLRRADELGQQATRTALGAGLDTTIAVPTGGAADAGTLAALARSGRTSVVLGEQFAPPQPALGYTATGLTRVRTRDGELTGLLADPELSAQLTAVGSTGSAVATQQLLSELASVTLERPSDPRSLLAVTNRRWNPDPARAQAALAALRSAPWVQLQPLQRLRTAELPDTPRAAPGYPASARSAELPRAHVSDVVDADRRLTRFAPALAEPGGLLRALREEALSLVSVAWRGRGTAAAAGRRPFLRDVDELYGGVGVVEGGPYNLLTGSGELPVRVRNRLPYPVTLRVRLQPRSGQLLADRAVPVALGAGGSRLVLVPTRSVANGNVEVDATLLSPDGTVLGQPTRMQVRVRRNWESRGILVLGGLLALLLATGLFRSVRRGRTRLPAGSVPDRDEQALGRARAAAGAASADAVGAAGGTGAPSRPAPPADRALPATSAGPVDLDSTDRTPVPDLGPPGGQQS